MNKELLKIALFGALIIVVYQFILYLGGVEWMFNLPLALLHYVILIVVMVLAVLRKRNLNAGRADLKSTFLVAFTTGAIITFSTALYSGVLYQFDPERKTEIIEYQKELFIIGMQERNIDQEKIDSAVMMRDQQTDLSNPFKESFFNWVKDLVIVAVISVILGMLIKSSNINFNAE